LGKALSAVRDARLDGRIGAEDELAFALEVVEKDEEAAEPVAAGALGEGER
jgi:hypothetical protein